MCAVNFQCAAEVTGVTFLDSDFAPVPKLPNVDPGMEIFQIWESDSCSDSGYYRSNRNLPLFLLKKWPRILLLLQKLKSDSGSGYVFFYFCSGSASGRKTQNLAGVDSGTPDPWASLVCTALFSKFTLFLSLPTKRLVGMFFKRLKSGVNHYLESKKEHKKGCFAQLVGRSRLGSDQASTSET